jgi:ankyrin repeat protein
MASMFGEPEVVELLLKKGAKVDVKTNGGETPLALARKYNRKEAEQLLLKAGAKE